MLGNTHKVGHSKNKCPLALTQKTLTKLWVLTACNTKVLPAFLFSITTYLPVQGVSGSVQTHFGTAHYTLWVMLCTFRVLNMHNTTQKAYNGQYQNVSGHHRSILRKKMEWTKGRNWKKEAGSTFILPVMRTDSWFNSFPLPKVSTYLGIICSLGNTLHKTPQLLHTF